MRFKSNPPDASALMTSARSFGNYDLASALADLIDNSIKARSTEVTIHCVRKSGEAQVRVRDNGHGMSSEELSQAMRPASTNPSAERAADDLGRFGWGMKSASLSQCRHLTVISRRDGELCGAVWDLDDLEDWKMGLLEDDEISDLADAELKDRDGTEIIWSRCDRLSERGAVEGRGFNDMVAHAKSRLAVIFHRYLAGEEGLRKLAIRFNGDPLKASDPFMRDHDATQRLPRETLTLDGQPIDVQAFVLPHYSKLGSTDHDRLGGDEGFVRNQGFYIYRQHRLILHGTWFRLVRHGELSQLVRIAVNIPNSLDEIWKITLDKADAQLPSGLRARLKDIVDGLRGKSGKVFQSRGARIRPATGTTPVWSKYVRNGEVRYYLNREHPLLAELLETDDNETASAVSAALGIIEAGFPVLSIGEDYQSRPDMMNQGALDREAFTASLDAALPSLLHHAGGTLGGLTAMVKITEPWASHGALVEEHLKSKGWWQDA
jgi:hypothetical protein